MKKITREELEEILRKHKLWLEYKEGGERANLSGSDLRGSNLRGSDLRVSDLRGSDLSGSDLRGSDLRGSDLGGSNLSGSDLRGSDLSGSNLRGSNLSGSDLRGSDLSGSNLRGSDLRGASLVDAVLVGADLHGADLSGADLRGAKNLSFPIACPEEAEFVGFKKARGEYIVKLKITADAKRSSATGRKCRCSKAVVISITKMDGTDDGTTEVRSMYDQSFVYRVGETVEVADFCEDRWEECAAGIHFFITRKEAEDYYV